MPARPLPPFALVRRPAASLASGCVSFIERQPVDLDGARRQWTAYVGALRAHGWPTVEVAPDDTLPNSVFIEDAVVMFGELAVITNPGEPTRHPEIAAAAETIRRLGYRPVSITRGTFDGGDVLKVGRTAYVGLSGRTSAAAVDELRELLRRGFFDGR